MNKILKTLTIIALSLTFPLIVFAQSGDGSSSDPFYGTISSSVNWDWQNIGDADGKIYIGTSTNNDLTIGSGGHLTIEPGATLIFTQSGSDLFITGTGRITADGGAGYNTITFTKASGNSNWGHISFQNMGSNPDPSIFDHCIFEYGYSTGPSSQPLLAGGAMQIDFDDVEITYSTFRNNSANFAGALIVNSNRNTLIENCYFESNEADECGGAMILYGNSTAEIRNCIFYDNYCQGLASAAYGGGAIWSYSNSSIIHNCTFVENLSDRAGDAIYSYSSSNMSIYNNIFWGSSDQYAGSVKSSTISTSAFEGSKPSLATNSIIISSISADHFVDGSSGDWSLKFKSPCLDAGTTTSPIIGHDYDNNTRIGSYDIGAYEVQYSRWDGSSGTSWSTAANWDQDLNPGSGSSNVIIPGGLSNYPTSGSTNFSIGSGKYLVLEAESQVTFGTLTNSGGTLKYLSDADGSASLIFTTYSDAGTESFELYMTGGGAPDHKWHYIAVPGSMSKTAFTNVNAYNLLSYDESEIVDSNMDGWQWHDGYDGTNSFTTLLVKKGYNFYHTADTTITLPSVTGLLNNMGDNFSLQYNGNGLNLIGNSLTCSIDWSNVVTSGNMRDAIYFTKDNAMVSWVGGVGTPGGTTSIIPPLQGFMVKALEAGCSIDFNEAGVLTHGTVNRYKSASIIPLVRFTINTDGVSSDETVIRLDNYATEDFDNELDASKYFVDGVARPQIFTQLGDEKYSINSVTFPSDLTQIPLVVKITEEGSYTIDRIELAGLDNTRVILRDTEQNFTIDMADYNSYYFSSPAGIIDNRFILEFSPMGVGTEDIIDEIKDFRAYSYSDILNITTDNISYEQTNSTMNVYDLTGRVIMRVANLRWTNGETKQFSFTQPEGIYIIEINNGSQRSTLKISHR